MELVLALGRAAGLSLAAGLNLYATLLALSLAERFDLVSLPPAYAALGSDVAFYLILVLYLAEFVADKVPWFDSVWDMIHTVVRPVGGAFLAVSAMGPSPPEVDAVVAVLGAIIAGTSHFTKASTRLAANASFIPGLGIILSLVEDLVALAMAALVLFVPVLALVVTIVLLVIFVKVLLSVRRRFRRRRVPVEPMAP